MKKHLPAIATVCLIGCALLFFVWRNDPARFVRLLPTPPTAASPEEVIWQMTNAAREGNVQAYLNCYSGAVRQNLEKTATEMGEQKFSDYLKQLNNEVTGIAVSDLEQSNGTASLKVEFVLRGKNEAQKHHFKFIAGAWKIAQVDGAEQIKTLIPYGADANGKE
ncbi:MAG: hypothetical protein ACKV2V_20615 [Blastocatellia bacterium]